MLIQARAPLRPARWLDKGVRSVDRDHGCWALLAVLLGGLPAAAFAQAADPCRPKDLPPIVKRLEAALSTGCRLGALLPQSRDPHVWVDVYQLDLRGAGNFSVRASSQAFDAHLRLYRADKAWVAENDDAADPAERGVSGLDASIHQRLAAGRYLLFVTGKGGTGDYALGTAFDGSHACPTRTLELNQAAAAAFSEADCRVYHVQRGSANNAFVHQYQLRLRRGGSLTLQSTAAARMEPARQQPLPPGDYTVLVESPRTGPYRLSARLQARSCPVLEASPNGSLTGTFSAADCRRCDVDDSGDCSFLKQYRLRVRRRGALTVVTTPRGVQSALRSGDLSDLGPGEHVLWVRSSNPGAFTLTTSFRAACPTREIAPDVPVEGALTVQDCRESDLAAGRPDNYLQEYVVKTLRPSTLRISVESRAFDPYVIFNGRTLARDATVSVERGEHRFAAAGSNGAVGPYTVRLAFGCPERRLDAGGSASGALSAGDCRVKDLLRKGEDNSVAQQYRLRVPQRGTLRIDLRSKAFDAYLQLFDANLSEIARDDDSGGDRNARISREVEPGEYVVIAKSAGAATGSYELQTALRVERCAVQDLAPPATVTGALAATDCRISDIVEGRDDSSHADQYRLRVARRSTLTVNLQSTAFDAFLWLLDNNRRQLATDDDGGGGRNARLVQVLDPGDYIILANSNSKEAVVGAYTLRAEFAPVGTPPAPSDTSGGCAAQDMGLNAEVTGTLSTTDCRLRASLAAAPHTPYGDMYRVSVTARGTLTVDLQSTLIDSFLYLLDAGGNPIAQDDDSAGSLNARLTRELAPGSYTVVVNSLVSASRSSQGAYTLRTRFSPAAGAVSGAVCPILPVGLNAEVSGTLAAPDCRIRDIYNAGADNSLADQYRVTVTLRGTLTIDMRSAALNAYLMLDDVNHRRVASDDNSGGGTNARISRLLEPGEYIIVANSGGTLAQTGAYTLATRFAPASGAGSSPALSASCPVQTLALGASVSAALGPGDCRMMDILKTGSDGSYADQYRVTLAERGTLTVDVRSTAFDAYLYLYDSQYRRIAYDNDGGSGTNARISQMLEPGAYLVFANSNGTSPQTGGYTIQATFAPASPARRTSGAPASCAPGRIEPNSRLEGALDSSDCRLMDILKAGTDTSRADQYRLSLDQPGTLTIDLESGAFDAFLFLLDASYGSIATNDDGGGGLNARIVQTLAAGDYIIVANSIQSGTGAYTLRTSFAPARGPGAAPRATSSCQADSLQLNARTGGALRAGDCRIKDILHRGDDVSYAHPYRITLPSRGTLVVDLQSAAFDAFLYLFDSDYRELATDNDSGGGHNARISRLLGPGDYIVAANSLQPATGAYTLQTTFSAEAAAGRPVSGVKPSCPPRTLGLSAQASGRLAHEGCRVSGWLGGADQSFAVPYQVTVPVRGTLTIDLRSTEFDPYLFLLDAGMRQIATDDDSGGGKNARISRELAAGLYTVLVNSYGNGEGAYTVQAAFSPVAQAAPPQAAPQTGGELAGFVGTWSEKWADVHEKKNVSIQAEGGRPRVSVSGGWRVWEEAISGGVLTFRKRGGGSNWEFLYTVRPLSKDRLSLTVFRVHDRQTFTGEMYR